MRYVHTVLIERMNTSRTALGGQSDDGTDPQEVFNGKARRQKGSVTWRNDDGQIQRGDGMLFFAGERPPAKPGDDVTITLPDGTVENARVATVEPRSIILTYGTGNE